MLGDFFSAGSNCLKLEEFIFSPQGNKVFLNLTQDWSQHREWLKVLQAWGREGILAGRWWSWDREGRVTNMTSNYKGVMRVKLTLKRHIWKTDENLLTHIDRLCLCCNNSVLSHYRQKHCINMFHQSCDFKWSIIKTLMRQIKYVKS